MNWTKSLLGAVCFGVSIFAVAAPLQAQTKNTLPAASAANHEAVRLSNRGAALMSQQFTERAAADFAAAFALDGALTQAAINRGIALLALQKPSEAEAVLAAALKLEPRNAQAWYNLGLAQHANSKPELALSSFEQAAKADPTDADSLYYAGACQLELHAFDKAISSLEAALKANPLHASAEFSLARALQRAGRGPEAKAHFARFQHLTGSKISSALGQAYGEQGHYSTVLAVPEATTRQKPMVAVHFAPEALPVAPAGFKASGAACSMDLTGSGEMDLVLTGSGKQALRLLHKEEHPAAATPPGKTSNYALYTELDAPALGLDFAGSAVGCAVGDFDGDGRNDLAIALEDRVELFRNEGKGKFVSVTAQSGIIPRNHPSGIGFVDYDHDGDLDLFLTGSALEPHGAANLLWRNNGNGTFSDQTTETGLGGEQPTTAATLTDFNNDRAIDLAVAGEMNAPALYANPREGPYTAQPLYTATAKLATSNAILMLDFDKDGWMDAAITHTGAPGLTLWRNRPNAASNGRTFERVALPLPGVLMAWGATAIDVDKDGWLDLAVLVETRTGPALRLLRNMGDGSFSDVSASLGLDQIKLQSPHGLLALDLGDGAMQSLLVLQQNAPPLLLRNSGSAANHAVRIDLTGLADNKTALGAKVEVFANGLWQKFEVAGASGYQTQAAPQLLVGLGAATQVDLVRILWPTGVLQDEIDLPATRVLAIKEADRRGSSCPVLFVWDGKNYRFVTDVIGAGVVGHWFTPTRHNIPNPGEWIKVDGSHVALVDGRLSLRFMEPMEEVNYIDQLRMVAVDHPATVEVNPDERFLDDPPFASGRVVASEGARLPVDAWDGEGRNVLSAISKRDHQFASGFRPTPYDGFANLHALTLELGELQPHAPLRLLMTGYVNYFSATSLYGAWQAGIKPESSYIEAQLADGSWQRLPGDAGFPAGLERTIVVDLSGKIPAGSHKIRLLTNLEIYWDQVLLDQSSGAQAQQHELPLALATLHFRGYPKQIEGASPGDLNYNYNEVSLTGSFQHQRGNYTRVGDVSKLVDGIDDRFAIFGTGEEIAAEFDTLSLPPLPSGWQRDYFFYANGFVKDMDWWDASPYTVSELPYHAMKSYPYPASEAQPVTDDQLDYELNWNDRFESGDPARAFRFHYQQRPSTPAEDSLPQLYSGDLR